MLSHLSRVRLSVAPWTVPTRLLCPWNSPGKNVGVGCHALLQGVFPTQAALKGEMTALWGSKETHRVFPSVSKPRRELLDGLPPSFLTLLSPYTCFLIPHALLWSFQSTPRKPPCWDTLSPPPNSVPVQVTQSVPRQTHHLLVQPEGWDVASNHCSSRQQNHTALISTSNESSSFFQQCPHEQSSSSAASLCPRACPPGNSSSFPSSILRTVPRGFPENSSLSNMRGPRDCHTD